MKRFAQEPGFPGLIGYKATRVILEGLAAQQDGESLKQTLLRIKRFDSLLFPVVFDAYGETQSPFYMAQVRGGKYKVIPE